MNGTKQISPEITVGPQPDESDLNALGRDGFQSVVNFRSHNEEGEFLSPEAEGQHVRSAGLKYFHLPVSMTDLSPTVVDQFRKEYASLPKPVFAHCKSGKRAGAMVMMQMACDSGLSGDETLDKAEQMGFECDHPQLREFVKNYVDNHSVAS